MVLSIVAAPNAQFDWILHLSLFSYNSIHNTVVLNISLIYMETLRSTVILARNTHQYQIFEFSLFWITVSTIPLCICAGTLFGGFLAEKIGNLWNLRISLLMELFGWLIIYFSQSFTVLMTGRILTGLGAGFSTPSTYLMLTDLSLVR